MSVILHTGIEHPNLLWIVITGIITFVAGTGFGAFWLKDRLESTEESELDPSEY